MTEPDWNPDTGGRPLAEILREAGIESANRAARRRSWDDPEETGIRQRRAEAAAARRPDLGRRKSDRPDEEPPVAERRAPRRTDVVPGPTTAAIPGMRPDRKPGVPSATVHPSAPTPPMRERREPDRVVPQIDRRPAQRGAERPARRAAPAEAPPQTGPIPVVRPEPFEDA